MNQHEDRRAIDPRIVQRGYEHDTTRAGRVLLAVGGLAVALGVALVATWYLRPSLATDAGTRDRATALDAAPPDFSYARHWVRRGDAIGTRREERRRLTSYGWVDRDAAVIHVPVERAMALLLEEGLHVDPQREQDVR